MNSNTHRLPAWNAGAVLRSAANGLLALMFALLVLVSVQTFTATGSVKSFAVLAANVLVMSLFLMRREAKSETTAPVLWLLSYAGTFFPMMLRPADGGALESIGYAIQLTGTVFLIVALLSLQRSFAIVPANRGIQVEGAYRLVRHPLYAAELFLLLGVVLANPSVLNAAIWLIECGLQLARARAEERFLSADPDYRAYTDRVRYRLVPGLF